MAETMHIGMAARLAGISVDTIRFYQKLGLIKGANRSAGGYRLFNGEQIRDLKFIAASSCCLPLLPFLFAAGAAGTSAFLVQLRPYLLFVSVLLIAFGFYKSWRARKCNCKPSRVSTFLLWLSAIVVLVFIFFPQVIANLVADLLAGKSWIESESSLL